MPDVKIERIKQGLTQQELAEKCGVIRQTISRIELGLGKPSVELAKKLSQILNIEWTDFFKE